MKYNFKKVYSATRLTGSPNKLVLQVIQSESANSTDGERLLAKLITFKCNLVASRLSQECKVGYKIRRFYSFYCFCSHAPTVTKTILIELDGDIG